MPLKLQIEKVDEWSKDAYNLWIDHWQELGMDLDLKVSPNIQKMRLMEDAGMWHVMTARDNGVLVGYLLALVSPHLHYKDSPSMLMVDAYFILPEYRQGVGVRLFKYMESFARQTGCIKIYLTCKVHCDHTKLFEALGYKLSDYAFIKRI